MIHVEHLTRLFGPFGAVRAIDDLSFHIERGEVVGFLGPNGAGKTTTLRILTGYLPASSGSARVCGLDVLRDSMRVRKKIGYLPESVPLYRDLRVDEMLRFQARLHGMSRSDFRRRAPAVAEQVGLGDLTRAMIGTLSRGQRQRVGLAVALLPEPEVLILDEPTSGLDPIQRMEVRKLLVELGSAHTVLVSSHILPEIEAVAQRVIILAKGKIAADGTADQLVSKLGGERYVEVHAALGPAEGAASKARELLAKLPGVRSVQDQGRVGVHHQFRIVCSEDLREDVGALAAHKGWALRELSFRQPKLEQIFAKIALEFESQPTLAGGQGAEVHLAVPAAQVPQAAGAAGSGLTQLALQGTGQARPPAPETRVVANSAGAAPAPGSAPVRAVYNLNPFEQGAHRDLSAPKPAPAKPTPPPAKDSP